MVSYGLKRHAHYKNISKQSYHRYLDFTLDRAERLDLNHDFGYYFLPFLFPSKKKREEEKENE